MVLVATSGDTGGAVLDGFARHAGTFIILISRCIQLPILCYTCSSYVELFLVTALLRLANFIMNVKPCILDFK